MYTYFFVSGIFNALASLLLGILVLSRGEKNKTNKIFALLCFGFTAWSAPYVMWPISKTKEQTLFWFQVLHYGAILIPIFYYHFVVSWFALKKEKILVSVGYILAFFFSLFVFSPFFIAGMEPKFSMRFWAIPGKLYYFYLVYFFFYYIYATILLYLQFLKSSGTKRKQTYYLLVGLAVAIAGGSTNYFLWFDINIPPYGNALATMHVMLGTYAIIVHRLMDIKVVLRKYSVYLLSLAVIVIPAAMLQYFYPRQLGKFSSFSHIFLIIVAVSIFPFIRDWFYKIANKYFFSSLYDTHEVISQISEQLRSTIDVDKVYRFISQALINAFHVKAVGVLIYNETKNEYFVQYNNSEEDKNFLRLPSNKNYQYSGMKISPHLCDNYLRKNIPIIFDDLKDKKYEKYKNDIESWQAIGIELLVPLIVKGRNIGMIALSAKESGDLYNNEDLYILNVIGTQVAIALENALLYQQTLNFNIKLKKEVAKQTKELIEANDKLTKLDQAKSEFISIASHQLRTPLSIIKGYISMILEGNFGPLTPGEKDSLDKVYKSNERLIDLVEGLLNISRIESGRLQFSFENKQLEELVASVYDELAIRAGAKNLKFEFIKPKTKLPAVNMDESKMRQVVMNLIDNSIKYTAIGSVTVSLKKQKDNILFCVTDTGVGIRPEDLPNLFKKFSRGTGSALINAEGTGLGLFVAKKMIESHGGRIWAESTGRDKGSQFYFEMPYVKTVKKSDV